MRTCVWVCVKIRFDESKSWTSTASWHYPFSLSNNNVANATDRVLITILMINVFLEWYSILLALRAVRLTQYDTVLEPPSSALRHFFVYFDSCFRLSKSFRQILHRNCNPMTILRNFDSSMLSQLLHQVPSPVGAFDLHPRRVIFASCFSFATILPPETKWKLLFQ